MARPHKVGLDYFPLDIDLWDDDRVVLLESEHGALGWAVYIRQLARVYADGYFTQWGERQASIASSRWNVDADTIRAVVGTSLQEGLFHSDLHQQCHVLTSRGIQQRYFAATARRKVVRYHEDLLLTPIDDFKNLRPEALTYEETLRKRGLCIPKPDSGGVDDDHSTQSKVKDRKEAKRASPGDSHDESPDHTSEGDDKPPDPPPPKSVKEAIALHADRYSDKQLRLVRRYWDAMKYLRKTDVISPNIVHKRMTCWEDYRVEWVQQAIITHLKNHATRRESYTDGILRGLRDEHEARKKGVDDDGFTPQRTEADREDPYADLYIDGSGKRDRPMPGL